MKPDQMLAVMQLRRWQRDRSRALRGQAGRINVNRYEKVRREGGREALLARLVDFERAFTSLKEEHQAVLVAVYLEGHTIDVAAELVGVSERKISYLKSEACDALTAALDKAGIL